MGVGAGAGASASRDCESDPLTALDEVVSVAIGAIGVPIGSETWAAVRGGASVSLLASAGCGLLINCMATGRTYEAMRGLLVSNLAAAALAFASEGETGESGDNGDAGQPRETRGDGGSKICKRCKLVQPLMRGDTGGSEFGRVAGDFGTARLALLLASQVCDGGAPLDSADSEKLTLRYRARGEGSEGVVGTRMDEFAAATTFS